MDEGLEVWEKKNGKLEVLDVLLGVVVRKYVIMVYVLLRFF